MNGSVVFHLRCESHTLSLSKVYLCEHIDRLWLNCNKFSPNAVALFNIENGKWLNRTLYRMDRERRGGRGKDDDGKMHRQ